MKMVLKRLSIRVLESLDTMRAVQIKIVNFIKLFVHHYQKKNFRNVLLSVFFKSSKLVLKRLYVFLNPSLAVVRYLGFFRLKDLIFA